MNPTRICIPVCASSLELLHANMTLARERADIVELRLDCLEANELAQLPLKDLLSGLDQKTIITLRATEQGGARKLSVEERAVFWRTCLQSGGSAFFDIELDLARELATERSLTDWSRIICSHHDFAGVPVDLEELYSSMAQTGAAVFKIAVKANDLVDCLRLFELLERARLEGRQLIALSMGNAGIATRILGPSRGSFLTYGAFENDAATAPGQLTAQQLRATYHIQDINADTQVFGLIGNPVMHSVSPDIHNAAFQSKDINGVFIPFEVHDVKAFFDRMAHPKTRVMNWHARGFSVTAPHKRTVIENLDWLDPLAAEIGAVNTVVVENSRLLGYNTDAHGFLQPLKQRLGELGKRKIAIIGAGGAANAAIWALAREEAEVTIFARDQHKASQVANRFNVSLRPLGSSVFSDYDIVINATPLGSAGAQQNLSPVTTDQLRGVGLVYDLVYNPRDTLLLRQAQRANCETMSGLQMLVAQAARQFELWTGLNAPIDVMRVAAEHALH